MGQAEALKSTGSASRAWRLGLAALAGLVALAIGPAETWAKKRVVLFNFSGPRAGSFQAQVHQILRQRATVLSARVYSRASRKLRRQGAATNVRRIAALIRAHGLIGGSVRRLPGRRYRLRIVVRAGRTGRLVAAFNVMTRRRRLRGAALRTLIANLRVALRRLPQLSTGTSYVRKRRKRARTRKRRRKRKKRKRVVETDDDFDDDDDDDDDDDTGVKRRKSDKDDDLDETAPLTDAEKADLSVRGRGLVIAGGLSVTARTLAFTFTPGIAKPPRGYNGSFVAGAYFTAELYPLGLDMKHRSAARNIGLTILVDQVIKINSKLIYDDPVTMMRREADLPTEQLRWGIGAVYRHNFGKKPTSPTVRLSARYNRFTFDIDKSLAPMNVSVDIPNVDYTYYDVGLGVRLPITAKIAIVIEGRFMLMANTGEIQQNDQFGGADVTGLDFEGGFEYRLVSRLWLRAGGKYTRIGFAFDGTGALATDVGGALDEYIGGYATLQYLF